MTQDDKFIELKNDRGDDSAKGEYQLDDEYNEDADKEE